MRIIIIWGVGMIRQSKLQHILDQWESSTLEADAYYYKDDLHKAGKTFCRTVDLLEPWLDKEYSDKSRVVRLFVLSCHNAAHVLSKQNKHKEAEYYYSHAHFRLLSLLNVGSNKSRLLESLLMELKYTFKQLKVYLTGKDKAELAVSVREESIRVMKQRYHDYVEDVFMA